jgi:hypothetical protein
VRRSASGARLVDGQQRFADQLEPGFQRHGFVGHAFVGGPDAAALAVAADHDALDFQVQHGKFNRRRRAE